MSSSGTRKPFLSVTMKDCNLKTFAAGGPGGQHQNTANTGVRIIHRASGAVGEARDSRSQLQNKHAAWRRMAAAPEVQGVAEPSALVWWYAARDACG